VFFACACAEEHTIVIELERVDTTVTPSLVLCDTQDDCRTPVGIFSSEDASLTSTVGIDVNQTTFTGAAIRIQFISGGLDAHCEFVDVELETVPLTIGANFFSGGQAVDVSCTPAEICTAPADCSGS